MAMSKCDFLDAIFKRAGKDSKQDDYELTDCKGGGIEESSCPATVDEAHERIVSSG
jgi:hypothetical protein